ncbi:hypothetical protein ACJ6WD_40010 [Streptomyces sp. VTCC 41912]|uniref:hypothetical protein n=1 Tax=Streptomyces sp. VTCC 41912 TaxID=3383243 RepID=UPI003896D346
MQQTPETAVAAVIASEITSDLDGLREWALAPDASPAERTAHAEMYAATLHEMRVMVAEILDRLPVREANATYEKMLGEEPEHSLTAARAWARAHAATTLTSMLEALRTTLPLDGRSVVQRASQADPTEVYDHP